MNSSKNNQRGASLIGILFIGGVLVFGGIVAAQVAPTYTEYRTIIKTAPCFTATVWCSPL